MNPRSNAIPSSRLETNDAQHVAPAAISAIQHFYWSVRREIWEYRSIYLAPLAVAALFLFGFLVSTIHLPAKIAPRWRLVLCSRRIDHAAVPLRRPPLMGTTFIVAVFYCLDALHGERRDRSILFWKSLPVSDLTPCFRR